MSITYTNAQTAVARSLGNAGDADQISAAGDAIKAAIQEWNLRHDWRFLLMDTSGGFVVASATITGTTTLTTTVANGFAGVNVGVAVSATAGTGSIVAGAVVTAVTSSTVIEITASSNGTVTNVTFAGDVPIVAGTHTYALP